MERSKRAFYILSVGILVGMIFSLFAAGISVWDAVAKPSRDPAPSSTPVPLMDSGLQPTPDRLAIPVLPENPSQVDRGREVYYYNCMPCHGDQGQGLTDEFRQLWVEDHRNCWDYGCHGGHIEDKGFPLPKFIPPVGHLPGALQQFPTVDDLYYFLHTNHPPQRPGALEETEYWDVTAFILAENGRLLEGEEVGPTSEQDLNSDLLGLAALLAASLLVAASLIWQARQIRPAQLLPPRDR